MKKLLSAVLALAMILSLTACGNAVAPVSEPEPDPDPEPGSAESISEPEAAPAAVEGVVKEVSEDRLILTLADGTALVLDTSGITGLDLLAGDTVRAEYAGELGSMTATKVEVTAKVEVLTTTGVVTRVDTEYVFLTLENGTEAALRTVSMEEGEVEVGDTLTVQYTKNSAGDGMTVIAVEVTKAEQAPEETAPDAPASQAAQTAQPAQETTSSGGNGTSSGTVASSGGTGSSYDGMDLGAWYREFLKGMTEVEDEDEDDEDYTPSSKSSSSSSKSQTQAEPEPPEDAADIYEAIRLINNERKKAELPALDTDSVIIDMTALRAKELATRFEHTRPDGRSFYSVFDDFDWKYSTCAENIYAGRISAADAVDWWMNSPGHKANILKDNVTKIAVGYYYDSSSEWKHYWVMLVATPK